MNTNMDKLYWMMNEEWYFINEDDKFELRENVPEKVKRSFELYMMDREEDSESQGNPDA